MPSASHFVFWLRTESTLSLSKVSFASPYSRGRGCHCAGVSFRNLGHHISLRTSPPTRTHLLSLPSHGHSSQLCHISHFTFQSPKGSENPTLKTIASDLPWLVMTYFSCRLSKELSLLSIPKLYQRNIFRGQRTTESFKDATGNVAHGEEKRPFGLIVAHPLSWVSKKQGGNASCEESILTTEPALSSSRNSLARWSRIARGKKFWYLWRTWRSSS